jgi:hypothetical protein
MTSADLALPNNEKKADKTGHFSRPKTRAKRLPLRGVNARTREGGGSLRKGRPGRPGRRYQTVITVTSVKRDAFAVPAHIGPVSTLLFTNGRLIDAASMTLGANQKGRSDALARWTDARRIRFNTTVKNVAFARESRTLGWVSLE